MYSGARYSIPTTMYDVTLNPATTRSYSTQSTRFQNWPDRQRNNRGLPPVLGFHHAVNTFLAVVVLKSGACQRGPPDSLPTSEPPESLVFAVWYLYLPLLFQRLQDIAGVQWIIAPVIPRRSSHGHIGVRILIWTGLHCRHLGMAV